MGLKNDQFNLERFLTAQNPVFETVLSELNSGRKKTHWMWFIFPQLRILGYSDTAKYYGIEDITERKAYLKNSVLRNRLINCLKALSTHKNLSAIHIFGKTDAKKLRSSLTLFIDATDDPELNGLIIATLQHYFDNERCSQTEIFIESS